MALERAAPRAAAPSSLWRWYGAWPTLPRQPPCEVLQQGWRAGIHALGSAQAKRITPASLATDTTMATETLARPWTSAVWRDADLSYVAGALQTINPLGFRDSDCRASYIRNMAETELNRRLDAGNEQPFDIGTGGFVVFMNKWDGVWHAVAAVTGYTAARFVADLPIPGQECYWEEGSNGSGGTYKAVRVKLINWD